VSSPQDPQPEQPDGDDWWLADPESDSDADDAAPVRRRRLGGRVIAGLAVLVAAVGVVLVAVSVTVLEGQSLGSIGSFPRVTYTQAARTVHLQRGAYVGYVETATSRPNSARAVLLVTPVDGVGEVSSIHDYRRDVTYTHDGRHGRARWTFRIVHTGTFQVRASDPTAPAGAGVALGRSVVGGLVVGVLLAVLGALLLTAAVGLLLIAWWRARVRRRRLAA